MRDAFPVIKYDYEGVLLQANGTALPLLGQWKCRNGKKIPTAIMKTYPEMALAMKEKQSADCCIQMGDCTIWFDIVPYPEAGYVGMYGYNIEMVADQKNTASLRMTG